MKTPVLVIYGGQSSEHEISCRSANFIIKTLLARPDMSLGVVGIDRKGFWHPQDPQKLLSLAQETLPILDNQKFPNEDSGKAWNPSSRIVSYMEMISSRPLEAKDICVMMVTHGTNGEDGNLQGFLELTGFSYIGPDTLGAAIGMDKEIAKILVQKAGLPVAPFIGVRLEKWLGKDRDLILKSALNLGFPVYVKPASLGSSVGISEAGNPAELEKAIALAFEFDEKILIETGLDIREIELAALGTYTPEISRAGEINATAEFYTFEAKYLSATGATIQVPAALTSEQESNIQKMSVQAFEALQLYGIARIDWFLEKKSGKFYFNEVNTLPGFTSISQYPKLWEASGLDSSTLLRKMIDLGLKRRENKNSLNRNRK
jgi:D-alanine-D-alanine ligase